MNRVDNVEKVGDLGGSVDVNESLYAGNEVDKFEEAIGLEFLLRRKMLGMD